MHIFTAQPAFGLCCSLASSKSVSQQHGHSCNNSRCPVALARPQTRQAVNLNRIASLRPAARPQPLDGAGALLCPINHHLVDWRVFHNTCAMLGRFGLSTGLIPLASSQLVRVIALASALASSRSFSQLFTGFLLTLALYGPLGPLRAFRASSPSGLLPLR